MDFVMRIFLESCKNKGVQFLKLQYLIPESASSSTRCASGEVAIDWCGYADDLLIVFENKDDIKKGIDILYSTFDRYRLNINSIKTKAMILNCMEPQPETITSNKGKMLEIVQSYKYLGCEIKANECTTGDTEINLRIDAGECKFFATSHNFLNMKINLKIRALLLNSLVRSRLVYGCQTWVINSHQMNRISAAYNGMLRKMTKGGYKRKADSWAFVHTNIDIQRMAKVESLESFVKKQQRNYVAHIIRKENSSLVKRLLFNNNVSHRQGPQTTILSSVLKNENATDNTFYVDARNRMF